DAVDISAASISLTAGSDVGDTAALALNSDTIDISAAAGNVDVDNTSATAVAVSDITASGAVNFDQSGGGDVTFSNVSAGNIVLSSSTGLIAGSMNTAGTLDIDGVSLTQTAAWTTGSVDLDSTGTINLANAISATGNVDIDADGLTGLAAAADISAGGNVNFGATRAGSLDLAADIGTQGGAVAFNQATALTGNVLLDTTVGGATGGPVSFNDTLNGAFQLAITAGSTGNVDFNGIVGGTAALAGLPIAANDITFNADVFTADGAAATFSNAGLLTFGTGTSLNFGGGLLQNGAGNVALGGDITTTGDAVSFAGDVQVIGNRQVTSAGGDLDFAGSVTGVGANTLGLNAGVGSIQVTDISNLAQLSLLGTNGLVLGGGINVGQFDTAGMSGALTVQGQASVTAANTDIDLSMFSGIDAATAGQFAVNAGSAVVTLPVVGSATSLDSLDVAGGTINLVDVTTSGNQDYTGNVNLLGELESTGGNMTVNGSVSLQGDSNLTANGVAVNGDIDGAFALGLAGDINVNGGIGQVTALTSLTTSGTAATFTGNITTSGVQTFGSPVTLGGDLTGGSLVFNDSVSLPTGSTFVSDTIDFNGGTSSVTGGGELSLVPATDGATIALGGSGATLVLNTAALDGYDAGLVIGGTRTVANDGSYLIDIAASTITVNSGLNTGTGSLTLLSRNGIDLRNGVLQSGQLVLVASNSQGTILNNGGQNTQLISDEMVLVAGSNIGLQGQEIRARADSGQGTLQIASGAEESAISDPTNSLEQLIGNEGAIAAAIVSSLGISINQNLLVTNAAQSSANREQTGGLTDEGFIDPSLFEDISLYEVLGSGIALPADQSEEGYFEEEGDDCNPEFEDCGSAAAPGAFLPY
ncbi:MAG: hypothetical protein R3270_10230, partial [Gammaproteobacteria bacterium]|nr:hypothetical protein [Gammaproteobacteria bacterium]